MKKLLLLCLMGTTIASPLSAWNWSSISSWLGSSTKIADIKVPNSAIIAGAGIAAVAAIGAAYYWYHSSQPLPMLTDTKSVNLEAVTPVEISLPRSKSDSTEDEIKCFPTQSIHYTAGLHKVIIRPAVRQNAITQCLNDKSLSATKQQHKPDTDTQAQICTAASKLGLTNCPVCNPGNFSLDHTIVEEGESGNCGYHALRNARLINNSQYDELTNIQGYLAFLSKAAAKIKSSRTANYNTDTNWLISSEIEQLTQETHGDESKAMPGNIKVIDQLGIFETDEDQLEWLLDFAKSPAGTKKALVVNETCHNSTLLYSGGTHWYACVATKQDDGSILFEIANTLEGHSLEESENFRNSLQSLMGWLTLSPDKIEVRLKHAKSDKLRTQFESIERMYKAAIAPNSEKFCHKKTILAKRLGNNICVNTIDYSPILTQSRNIPIGCNVTPTDNIQGITNGYEYTITIWQKPGWLNRGETYITYNTKSANKTLTDISTENDNSYMIHLDGEYHKYSVDTTKQLLESVTEKESFDKYQKLDTWLVPHHNLIFKIACLALDNYKNTYQSEVEILLYRYRSSHDDKWARYAKPQQKTANKQLAIIQSKYKKLNIVNPKLSQAINAKNTN